MWNFPSFLRVFTDSCLSHLDLAFSSADSVCDLSRNSTEIETWNKPKWKHPENGWRIRWRNETGARTEHETCRFIIDDWIRPFGIWKCARHFYIPYEMVFFVNFIRPNKGIFPLCIFPKFCFFKFQILVLLLFKFTLSHVILYYPSRSFYARNSIAMNGTLAQYHRLWELVLLCWRHFCPPARPSSVRVRLHKTGDTTGRENKLFKTIKPLVELFNNRGKKG